MPKRDENYMRTQREAIAKAALGVLIEKGYYEASLRDICRAAGISNGAFYTHFATREEVVVAACAVDHAIQADNALPKTWDEYAGDMLDEQFEPGTYASKRFRLSLQFVAELTQMNTNPEGLSTIFAIYRDNLSRALMRLKENGIVALPLGVEVTTDLHLQLFTGAQYQIGSNKDSDREAVAGALRKGLALTAGLLEQSVADDKI